MVFWSLVEEANCEEKEGMVGHWDIYMEGPRDYMLADSRNEAAEEMKQI
jgi:hypothetical protein